MSDTSYHTLIKEMPLNDRPRERLQYYGASTLQNAELLAITLRTGSHKDSALSLAQKLINRFGGLPGLARASVAELCTVDGIGLAKAAEVQASLELGKRLVVTDSDARPRISSPADAANILMGSMSQLSQEEMHVLLLDTRNRVQRVRVVYRGNVNASMIRISELFTDAVKDNAPSIILAHNHPSGDTSPSADDIQVTRDAVKAGNLLDIQVLDHLIIGAQSFLSMKERGLGF
jgi:DNA repair protein RadC